MWLEIGAATAEVQAALNAGVLCHFELISTAVRLTTMESFFSSYRGSSPSQHPHVCADYHGDGASVSRQAIHVLNMQAGQYRAEVQDSPTREGVAEKEDAEPFWSLIL
jgi:hypothetical protein